MRIKRKCEFCHSEYDSFDDIESIVKYGIGFCPYCVEINQLKEFLESYSDKHHEKEWDNDVHKKNMIKDDVQHVKGVTSYTSRHYDSTYKVEGRSKFVIELIETIDYVRRLLAVEVGGQIEILDSIYEKKDVFWGETGNLLRYVHNASFEYVVIKLKELLSGNKSKYSITKIRNILTNNRNKVFENQKIFTVFKYDNGDEFEIKYDPFPIIDYLDKIENLLNSYKHIINAIADYRDNYFAHISKLKDNESSKNLSYVNIKRIYNMLKLIYDGFLFAIAPDKLTSLFVEHNIWFSHLNNLVNKYKKEKGESYD